MARRHFVGLDGLKGIALIAIVLYHCDQRVLHGGFLGVDVFFTISGFLIFSSLLRRIDAGEGMGLGEYCLKRLRRIYPALFALVPITVTLAWFVNRDMLVGIRDQIITVLLGCYNWYAISSGGSYFSQTNPDLCRHLWFMAVLMQFYVVAPLLITVLRNSIRRWIPVLILVGLSACSALSMALQYHPGDDPTRVYFGSDTHAAGLWLGAAFAWGLMIWQRDRDRGIMPDAMDRIRRAWGNAGPVAAFVALLALIWMMRRVDQGAMAFQGGIFVASVLSVVMIAGSIPFGSWMQDLLVFKPLVLIGRHSYGIYLWHWPLYLFVRTMLPQWTVVHAGRLLAITAVCTAIMSIVSWRLFESPVLRGGFLALARPTVAGTADVMRCCIAVALLVGSCGMGAYAVAHAPVRTSVERDLMDASMAMAQGRENHAVLNRNKTPAPRKPAHKMPNGTQMTAIGDSVMLASSKGLQSTFPGITVDAETSRSMTKAVGLVNQLKAQPGGLRQWVLVGLATNSAVTDDQLGDLLDAIGSDHVLVLINAHAPVSWVSDTNAALKRFAGAHPNDVVLVDWDTLISAHPDELARDGIHPGVENTLYSQLVKDTITNWIKQGH